MTARRTAAFRGFPREALEFLRDLEADNDRDWFKANRGRYEDFLMEPVRALAADLSGLGAPRTFRPWNDTRFRPGPPIKEHVGLAIGYGEAGVYYVEISLDGLLVAGGMHAPAADQVDRLRRAIDDRRTGAKLERAIATAEAAGLEVNEPDLVRGPRGYPADHPRMDLLRRRRLVVFHRHPLRGWLHGPEAGRRIRSGLDAATPLVRWLREHVGPSQRR